MEELLNPASDPMFIDQVVQAAFNTQGPQQKQAMAILAQFQELPDSWQKVPMILENSISQNSKVGYRLMSLKRGKMGHFIAFLVDAYPDPRNLEPVTAG
jgi:hypothetical protein